jgi:LmbE family N-acetylglucosaminyl deacetylase
MRVMVMAAHPDDETIFGGGMIAKYAAEGHDVVIVLSTRGEGGERGDPPLCTPEELGAVREAEARAAAKVLGARDVVFLPFQDPPVGPDDTLYPINVTLEDYATAIAGVMLEAQPDVVLTHGSNGEYGHPQHVFTHKAVFAAIEQLRQTGTGRLPSEVLTWGAAYPDPEKPRHINKDDPADIVLNVSPWLAQKVAAYAAHRTQHGLFFRKNPGKVLEDLPGRTESFRRWIVDGAASR